MGGIFAVKLQDQKMTEHDFKILEGQFLRSKDLLEGAKAGVDGGQHLITSQA